MPFPFGGQAMEIWRRMGKIGPQPSALPQMMGDSKPYAYDCLTSIEMIRCLQTNMYRESADCCSIRGQGDAVWSEGVTEEPREVDFYITH